MIGSIGKDNFGTIGKNMSSLKIFGNDMSSLKGLCHTPIAKFKSLKLFQRQLFRSLEDWEYLHFSVCSGTETEEGLLKLYKAGKRLLYVKRNKAISLGNVTSKVAGQRKPEGQWTADERKAANLDQRLKSLIMSVLPDDQMNSVINCLTAKSTWDDLILYHEGPSDVKESRVIDLKLCYNTFKFKEGESLTQTFTRYKALMNELVNDGIKLSKLEINIGFINGLPKKWLSFCQSLRNTNHVKDSELASLFGKLKYEENLIDSIYETKKSKSLISATPLSTAFLTTSIVKDFQDNPDDEEDTRSSHEYLNDLEEEYQARALLAK
ncbi:hypothetical protein Tco_0066570 [Tanacetum coccineum]